MLLSPDNGKTQNNDNRQKNAKPDLAPLMSAMVKRSEPGMTFCGVNS